MNKKKINVDLYFQMLYGTQALVLTNAEFNGRPR